MRPSIHTLLYPELRRFPTRKQAADALSQAGKSRGDIFVDYMLIPILVVIFQSFDSIAERHLGIGPWIYFSISLGIIAATIYVTLRFQREPIRRRLRELLIESGFPTCIFCGYDLAGLEACTCPECGAPLDLPVDS